MAINQHSIYTPLIRHKTLINLYIYGLSAINNYQKRLLKKCEQKQISFYKKGLFGSFIFRRELKY